MRYFIKCDNGYVGRKNNKGSFYIVPDKTSAVSFDKEQSAKNVMETAMPKEIKNRTISVVSDEVVSDKNITNITDVTNVSNQYIPVDMNNVKSLIESLSNQFKSMKSNKEWLLEMESKIDKEISDILHYIEFYNFSACDGYKLARELKTLRLKRRDIKNQLEAINIISCHTCNMLADGKTNKALNGIECKQYTPRVLTEMFTSKIN